MLEILISSTVLILALTALRFLLRGKINPRLQYALWLLAALRLLLPVSLVRSPVSVMNAVPDVPAAMQRLNEFPRPTFAVIQGACFGGGAGIACCVDVALATPAAIFGLTEGRVGVAPTAGFSVQVVKGTALASVIGFVELAGRRGWLAWERS